MRNGIFIDLDETLLTSAQTISAYDYAVIKQVSRLGHRVYLITGKSLSNAERYYHQLGLSTLLITSLGQVITNPSDLTFKPRIVQSDFNLLRKAVAALGARVSINNYLFETHEAAVYVKHLNPSNLLALLASKTPPRVLQATDYLDVVIGSYVEIERMAEADLIALTNALGEAFTAFEFSYWQTNGELPIINIKPINIGKSVAMLEVKAIDQLEYLISFGNGWNDRNMLASADEGYAMTNASNAVKQYAKFEALASNNDSGVGKTLAHIFQLDRDLISQEF